MPGRTHHLRNSKAGQGEIGISRMGRVLGTPGDVLEKGLQRQCPSQHSGCHPGHCPTRQTPGPAQIPRQVRGERAHLVYLHRRGAGVRGQVRPFQVKCPERDEKCEAGATTPPIPSPSPAPAPPQPLCLPTTQRNESGRVADTALHAHSHLFLQQPRRKQEGSSNAPSPDCPSESAPHSLSRAGASLL